jgi:predicted NodU family carbamoyl transferase
MYRAILGFNDKDDHLSWLVRDNQITREEALERVAKDRKIPTEAIKDVLSQLDIEYSDFERALSRATRR